MRNGADKGGQVAVAVGDSGLKGPKTVSDPGVMPRQLRFDEALLTALRTAVLAVAPEHKLPLVSHFELPPPADSVDPNSDRLCNNFGALVLEDGTVGMTYVALDGALAGLRSELEKTAKPRWAGSDVLLLADLYTQGSGWERALGLAAINAASQWLLAMRGDLAPAPSSVPMLDVQAGDHVGMVGHFGRLIDPIRAAGASLTVIELKADLVREEPSLVVTLDRRQLENCNKVIITGTTLLNQTLDEVLQHCHQAKQVNLLGPSASCLGEPLFDRGVTRVGGFHVLDASGFLAAWRAGKSWRQAGFRYYLSKRV